MPIPQNLRVHVRGLYDLQRLRIQVGNRLIANFKTRLGQAPGQSEETLDDLSKKLLADIRATQVKITDIVKLSDDPEAPDEEVSPDEEDDKKSEKKASKLGKLIVDLVSKRYMVVTEKRKTFPNRKNFSGDTVISDYTELCLISQYVDLEKQEQTHVRRLDGILEDYPIYKHFLEGVKGCGSMMSAVILSEIDIHKAQYASSLLKYCGIDVVGYWQRDRIEHLGGAAVSEEHRAVILNRHVERDPLHGHENKVDGKRIMFANNELWFNVEHNGANLRVIYTHVGLGGRSKKKEHLVERSYIDKDGNEAKRMGITFSPLIKTKLLGVLAPCIIKCKGEYSQVYYDWKNRYAADSRHTEKTKGHIHKMAIRKMIKQFLQDLYNVWRKLEGLPVTEPYAVQKLGFGKQVS